MRIIAGTHGGRRIEAPRGADTRPTSDRVREALFSMLEHEGVLADAWVLDLFAGSGSLGLEARSRGARRVDLVDSGSPAVRVAEQNVEALGERDAVHVHRRAVLAFLHGGPQAVLGHGIEGGGGAGADQADAPGRTDLPDGGRAVLALLDPPYPLAEEDLAQVLDALSRGWLAPGAVVVVERSSRSPEPTWPAGLERFRRKDHGETTLWFAEPTATLEP